MEKTEEHLITYISAETGIPAASVAHTVSLLDNKKTVPFIARYRKELTGSLDEEQIREIEKRIVYLRNLEDRKTTILKSIEEQGKLTIELRNQIVNCYRMIDLEDIYLPYKPKRKTRATLARSRGLGPLAEIIRSEKITEGDIYTIAERFVSKEGARSPEEALKGAQDIIAEEFSEKAPVRKAVRKHISRFGKILTKVKRGKARSEFEMYYDYSEVLRSVPPHRVLAINRAEKEGYISVSIDDDRENLLKRLLKKEIHNPRSVFVSVYQEALVDGYTRLIYPSVSREIRKELTNKAETRAISVFSANLRQLLLQRPVRNKVIMGIDPGYRTGCKVAVIDKTGRYLTGETIYPHEPRKKVRESLAILRSIITEYNVDVIAIGNGTASRETVELISELIKEEGLDIRYVVVSEAGASVYSASEIAREEFPDLEASLRGNISIARRLQDPLAELVKIEPKSIGVGMYQHDVNQKELSAALTNVVESCVNLVGVNVNTASRSLLKYVSGLTAASASAIIKYRDEHGPLKTRMELLKIRGIGESTFELCAGFLRIPDGDVALDNTAVHPESYPAVEKLMAKLNLPLDKPAEWKGIGKRFTEEDHIRKISAELGIGIPTFRDILESLEKPGLDPRDEFPEPLFRKDILEMEDLKPGMRLRGTITNVTDFGAFIDIGLKRDGLIHISQLADRFVKNPLDVVSVGEIVEATVISVDAELGRIGLSLRKNPRKIGSESGKR